MLLRPKPATASGPNVYEDLRTQALQFRPEGLGASSPDDPVSAYGLLMDIGVGSNTATVTSFSSGDASLYTSTGGGVLGGIGHETVRTAARAWVSAAQQRLDLFAPTTTFPHPAGDHVRFFVLTNRGVLTAEASRASFEAKPHAPLLPVWAAGQDVLTAIRLSTPGS